MKAPKKTRVQLDLLEGEAAALDAVKRRCGLRSRADAVRTALAVLEWVEAEYREGRKVVSIGEGHLGQLVLPGLQPRSTS